MKIFLQAQCRFRNCTSPLTIKFSVKSCTEETRFFWDENANNKFDVTMGSFIGSEYVKLVGIDIQPCLKNILYKTNFGLCWDDELVLSKNLIH